MAKNTGKEETYTSDSQLIINEYSTRRMRTYVVTDTEMHTLSIMNGAATVFFSIAAFCASFPVSIWANTFVADVPSPAAQRLGGILQGIGWAIAALFAVLGTVTLFRRHSLLGTIKRESLSNSDRAENIDKPRKSRNKAAPAGK